MLQANDKQVLEFPAQERKDAKVYERRSAKHSISCKQSQGKDVLPSRTEMETGAMASEAGPSTATPTSAPPAPTAPQATATEDPLPTPQLDTAGLILSLDEEGKERARVRGGVMSKLSRVVLFSENIPEGEKDHFSVIPLVNFRSIPPDLTALHKIPQESRRQERVFRYKGPGDTKWNSYLFARCEEGK